MTDSAPSGTAMATFGGGCFWCLDAVFRRLRGVQRVVSGYAGGHVRNPTYEQVCGMATGHIEVVQLTYDPAVITYRELLEVLFAIHDPTTLDRQGADRGPQYRSIVYAHDEAQRAEAAAFMAELEREQVFDAPIVTKLEPLPAEFWPAEAYHQDYYARNQRQGYCQVVIAPKVAKLRASFADKLVAA